MAPLSYLSVVLQHPALGRPLCSQFGYLPLVGIAAVILVLIANCGDGDAPVGPRRRDPSYDAWSPSDAESIADVEIGNDNSEVPSRHPMEAGGTQPVMPPPSPTQPPPYSRRPPFPY